MKNIKFTNHKRLSILFFGLTILLLTSTLQANFTLAPSKIGESEKIQLYYISTRESQNPNYKPVEGPGYYKDVYLNISKLTAKPCPKEIVIFVHGWEDNETTVKERLNRVKLSLENNNYHYPLIGFSWSSDTDWTLAQNLAKLNGPLLAKFILDVKKTCSETDIRIIAHSLGSRVVLSALDSLYKNTFWNTHNFKIASVHLMGAAVDNEEVSTNPEDILKDPTNWNSPKSDYGYAVGEEVIKFYNLFSSNDNMLELNLLRPYLPYQVYPSFEFDQALGQSGYQKIPYNIKANLPRNYNDTNDVNVTNQLVAICDADGDGHPDKPFIDGETIAIGDNHRGYLGYRYNETKIINDGAVDIVVDSWNNTKQIMDINPNFNASSMCHDSSKSPISYYLPRE